MASETNGGPDRPWSRRSLLSTVGGVLCGGTSIAATDTVTAEGDTSREGEDAAVLRGYSNPVHEPVLADPSVVRTRDGSFFVVGTEDAMPGRKCEASHLPILRSDDLVSWEYVGSGFDDASRPDWKKGGLWAPDVVERNGRIYLYYSLSTWGDENPGIGVATWEPGGFADHGKLFGSSEVGVGNSIDPHVHVRDGRPYLFWGSFEGIYCVELTHDGLDWRRGTMTQVAGDAYEAPYVVERDGYYYLFVSTGGCCDGHESSYAVSVGRSRSLTGPYHKRDGTPMVAVDEWTGRRPKLVDDTHAFAGPGHNSVVRDDAGTDWLLMHAYDRREPATVCGETPRRSLVVTPVTWEDGWPTAPLRRFEPRRPVVYRTVDASADARFEFREDGYAVVARGRDVWTYADEYGAIYHPDGLDYGGTVVARVDRQDRTHEWAKAGIMVRNDVTAAGTSPGYVNLQVSPDHGVALDWDADADGNPDHGHPTGETRYPVWLKLSRLGNRYTGSYRFEDTGWREVATVGVPSVANRQDAAVFATSHADERCRVDFGRFEVQ